MEYGWWSEKRIEPIIWILMRWEYDPDFQPRMNEHQGYCLGGTCPIVIIWYLNGNPLNSSSRFNNVHPGLTSSRSWVFVVEKKHMMYLQFWWVNINQLVTGGTSFVPTNIIESLWRSLVIPEPVNPWRDLGTFLPFPKLKKKNMVRRRHHQEVGRWGRGENYTEKMSSTQGLKQQKAQVSLGIVDDSEVKISYLHVLSMCHGIHWV